MHLEDKILKIIEDIKTRAREEGRREAVAEIVSKVNNKPFRRPQGSVINTIKTYVTANPGHTLTEIKKATELDPSPHLYRLRGRGAIEQHEDKKWYPVANGI